jgi:hypothetical protein
MSFFFVTDEEPRYTIELVPDKLYHPSVIFVAKAKS